MKRSLKKSPVLGGGGYRRISPRFVLHDIRNFFRPIALKCVFMFKSNSLCKTRTKLVAFFWCRQDQKGPGGADIHTIPIGYVSAV